MIPGSINSMLLGSANTAPTWTTSAGSIGSFDEDSVVNFQFQASDSPGDILTFTIFSGSLPTGLNLSTSGLLSGTAPAVSSDTVFNFILRVTDDGGLFENRSFSATINNIVIISQTLWSWGRGANGLLGSGDTLDRSSPVQVGSLQTWLTLSAAGSFTHVIKNDGTLWTWGVNNVGGLGVGDTINRSSPVQVGNLTDWSGGDIASGNSHTLVVKGDGALWSWGHNDSGALGLGDSTFLTIRSSPVQVGNLSDWNKVSAGQFFSLSIKDDGTLWAWGKNSYGQLGINNTFDRSSPVQVSNLTDWATIDVGGSVSFAIKTDGTLWSWGFDSSFHGALGFSNPVSISSPTQLGSDTDWVKVTANNTVLAIKSNGTLWSWGSNNTGQLGHNDTINRSSPTQIGNLTDWQDVIIDVYTVQAIKTNGELWAWGRNANGQLGLGNTINYSSPIQVGSSTDWITSLTISSNSSFALRTP